MSKKFYLDDFSDKDNISIIERNKNENKLSNKKKNKKKNKKASDANMV